MLYNESDFEIMLNLIMLLTSLSELESGRELAGNALEKL
jgi:hypothetical protein